MAYFVRILGVATLGAALSACAVVSGLDAFNSAGCWDNCDASADESSLGVLPGPDATGPIGDGDLLDGLANPKPAPKTGAPEGGPDAQIADTGDGGDASAGDTPDAGDASAGNTGETGDAGDAGDAATAEAGCSGGLIACNGACVNEQTDNDNCGGCGAAHACTGGMICHAGACCTETLLPPSLNVDATQWTSKYQTSPVWNCNAAGTTTINSTSGTVSSTSCALGTPDVSTGVAQSVSGGPSVMVIRLKGLTVTNNHVIQITGQSPVIFLVAGNVVIDSGGKIDASAVGTTAGAGGNITANCGGSTGADGGVSTMGAGGGGFGTAGGAGRTKDNLSGGAGGAPSSATNLQPLRGGCAGGSAADGYSLGGAGGGAFEISASGTVTIGTGTNVAILSAAGGGSPAAMYQYAATGGGGSGGGILVVAPNAPSLGTGGAVRVHGGAAGAAAGLQAGGSGQDGHSTDDNAASGGTAANQGGATGGNGGRCSGNGCGVASAPGASGQAAGMGDVGSGGGGGGGRVQITTSAATAVCQ